MNGHSISILVGLADQVTDFSNSIWKIRWEWNWPPWATLFAAAAIVFWVGAIYAREISPSGKRVRAVLALLRLVAILIVVLMFAEPTLEWFRVARPRLVMLIDRSASMATNDVILPSTDGGVEKCSRIDAVKRLLVEAEESFLDRLAEKFQVDVVAFDQETSLLNSSNRTLAEKIRSLSVIGETAEGTSLGGAVGFALRELPGRVLAAVVLLTDGVSTQGPSLETTVREASSFHVPIYSVAVGSERRRPDIVVENLIVEELVFPGDRLQVEAMLRATGFSGRTATVKLYGDKAQTALAQTEVELPTDGEETSVRLALRPTEPGDLALELVVEPFEREINRENNSVRQRIKVSDKKIHTLLFQSTPSYEYRALKSLLERDPAIDLHVYLQEADASLAEVDESVIAEFPADEQALNEYDVLIVGEVDPALLPSRLWPMIEQFVSRHGGGMACIAGPRFMPRAYTDTPTLQVLLPVEMGGMGSEFFKSNSSFNYLIEPTAFGRRVSSLMLGETQLESKAIWQGLPAIAWLFEGVRPKPGAQVLATCSSPDGELLPVILRHYVGAGEVLFHATDETWRWRWRTDDRYFARYWGQAVRRLGRTRLTANRQGIQLSVDRSQLEPGNPIRFQARFRNPLHLPKDGEEVVVELRGAKGARREVVLRRRTLRRDIYEASAQDLLPDAYEARLLRSVRDEESEVARFEIKQPIRELARVAIDFQALRQLAKASGGQVYNIDTAAEMSNDLPIQQQAMPDRQSGRKLWNSHGMIGLLVLCLSTEWLLRRHYGML